MGLDGQEKVSFVWLRVGPAGQDIGCTAVPGQVVRYESSSAKLNRLGRMQVRDKAKKTTPREQEDDEEAAGGGAGREGV